KQYKLSQKEVAKALDVSPSIISGYETGERAPSLENLVSLSYLYRCSTDYLLGKEKNTSFEQIDTSKLTALQIKLISDFVDTIE
ncbi:MAG: helix-turn-helix transcriptional regulator, partial [Butyrivibrio sp.]|nr:helix-turn-helix transcriptional regulator [Butyrivibrio sp.]